MSKTSIDELLPAIIELASIQIDFMRDHHRVELIQRSAVVLRWLLQKTDMPER